MMHWNTPCRNPPPPSPPDLTVQGHAGADIWWLLKNIQSTSRRYASYWNTFLFIYRPQRRSGKVIFSQASVILFTGGGVCLSECWDTPLPRRPPLCALHAGRYSLQAGGMHAILFMEIRFCSMNGDQLEPINQSK